MNSTYSAKPKHKNRPPTYHHRPQSRRAQPGNGRAQLPLYLRRQAGGRAGLEQEADHMADSVSRSPDLDAGNASGTIQRQVSQGASGGSSPVDKAIQRAVRPTRGQGRPLPEATRQKMEGHLGGDFGQVRVHTDDQANQLAQAMGANAFTSGNDIYFNRDRFAPGAPGGRRLLAHELTHVMQQDGDAGGQVQFDLMQSMPTALGGFEIDMATRSAPRQPGMEGNIRFFPDPNGPYSAQIGLVQVVNTTDVGGRTTSKAGKPVDWTNVGAGGESGRMDLMTTGTDGAPEGWFVDSSTATRARGSSVGPNYIEHFISPAPSNQFGWLRSPTDWRETSLWDYPNASFDVDFDFETVAKATDTQTVYGALEWGFGIRSGAVQNEYAQAFDAESAVFNEALERFRGYYTHEPIVIYFDTGQDIPLPGEEDKISGVMDYLNRYPDVMVQIEGFADERGRAGMNADLSMQRALNVQNLMMLHGLDSSRVDYAIGWGETQEFAAGRDEGTWRANRRVVVSFQRTVSTPIVMP